MVQVQQIQEQIRRRSVELNPFGCTLVLQSGAEAEEIGRFDIESEGKEPLFRYILPDGRTVREIFVPGGFRLCLADENGGGVIEESLW